MELDVEAMADRGSARRTEMVVEVPPLPMPHEGVYALELYAAEERLGALRIPVGRLKEGTKQ